ncbi:hypothetical protein CsatB_003314 [Cannabis sativa]
MADDSLKKAAKQLQSKPPVVASKDGGEPPATGSEKPPSPPPPEKPLPGDCCGSGCVRCIWDIYYDEIIFIQDLRSTHKSEYNQDLSPKVLQLDVILHSLPNYNEVLRHKTQQPPPPKKPLPGDCCGSGCVRCIWDIYYDELEDYNKLYKTDSKPS